MAAEGGDGQERQESPTQRRLTQAHDEGRVPRSQELGAAVVTLAGAAALATFAGTAIGRGATEAMMQTGGWLEAGPFSIVSATTVLREVTIALLLALTPFLVAVLAPTLLVGGLQARGVLSFTPVAPDLSRISPIAGWGRLFSLQSLFTLLKSLVKLIIIGCCAWIALRKAWPSITALSGAEAGAVVVVARSAMTQLVLATGLAFLLVAGADYAFMTWRHHQDLRMSRQEVIQEHRETEGNPMVKSRMRSLAQSLARRRMLGKVKEADVIVVNPTEIAVALRYDASQGGAPVVVAMGRRKLAERIRAIAREAGVPVVQNIPVARALIATGKVGMPIPPALYAAVAEVLAFVYRQRGRLPSALAGARRT